MKRRNTQDKFVFGMCIAASFACFLLVINSAMGLNLTHMIFGDIGQAKRDSVAELPEKEGSLADQETKTVQGPTSIAKTIDSKKLQQGDFYQYTDKKGVVTFTDNPLSVPRDQIAQVKVHDWSKQEKTTQTQATNKIPISNSKTTKVIIENDQVFVPVVLYNDGKFVQCTLLLDTGATHITVSNDIANQLNIDRSGTQPLTITLADNRQSFGYRAIINGASAGGSSSQNIAINVIEMGGSNRRYDGQLGMNFLKRFKYHVDFDRQVIQWY